MLSLLFILFQRESPRIGGSGLRTSDSLFRRVSELGSAKKYQFDPGSTWNY